MRWARLRETCRGGQSWWQKRRLTLFAKTIVILVAEVVLNALIWIVSVIVFTRTSADSEKILSLALVAWTTGLRHGLDADHISAIDNATRRIVSVPLLDNRGLPRMRRPVTVGLFFSLGHSTIVVVTIIAIAISTKIASHLDTYGDIGSIIGASVSGSFLLLIGCINTFILLRTWSRRRKAKRKEMESKAEEIEDKASTPRFNGLLTRLAMPILRTVDRPWKLFPVGLLFGLGFDTASSIALLSVAVIAQQDGGRIDSGNGNVVLLAFLFTAGMTMVDSIDSCLMIWAYAPDFARNGRRRIALWEQEDDDVSEQQHHNVEESCINVVKLEKDIKEAENTRAVKPATDGKSTKDEEQKRRTSLDHAAIEVKVDSLPIHTSIATSENVRRSSPEQLLATMDESASRMSLLLTLLSILIAFAIGFIVLLGLIGDQCTRCTRAADLQAQTGSGGLEGRWWLAWRRANDNSGYVGAAIVGLFGVLVTGYYLVRFVQAKRKKRKDASLK